MGKSKTRREFLADAAQIGILASGGLALSSCAALDTYFDVDKKFYDNEVVIIGAGSAGLAAAHFLKKNRIPYRVFEASRRVGGRIYTLETAENKNGIELGASSFDLKHKIIFNLAKEYKLEIDEFEPNVPQKKIFFYKSKWVTQQEIVQMLKPHLQNWSLTRLRLFSDHRGASQVIVHPLALSFDQWKIRDYLSSLKPKIDPELVQLLIRWVRTEMSANEDQVSALQWLLFWDREASNSSVYKIQGGNEKLIRAMYERVAGVIPNHLVQTEATLLSVKENGGNFECSFKTPKGGRRISAQFLILALPVNQLKHIQGLTDLPLAQTKKEAIFQLDLSSQAKMVLGRKEQISLESGQENLPIHTQLLLKQQLARVSLMPKQAELLWSIPAGAKRPKIWAEEALTELTGVYKKFRTGWNGSFQFMDWSQREGIQGAQFFYRANQFYKYRAIFTEPDFDGRLVFAGDYVHPLEWSTWSGALETGIWAAEKVAAAYTQLRAKKT